MSNKNFKGINLDEASVETTLEKTRELLDKYSSIIKENNNLYDDILKDYEQIFSNIADKLVKEFKTQENYKEFYDFLKPRLSPKQKDDFIEFKMEGQDGR